MAHSLQQDTERLGFARSHTVCKLDERLTGEGLSVSGQLCVLDRPLQRGRMGEGRLEAGVDENTFSTVLCA